MDNSELGLPYMPLYTKFEFPCNPFEWIAPTLGNFDKRDRDDTSLKISVKKNKLIINFKN